MISNLATNESVDIPKWNFAGFCSYSNGNRAFSATNKKVKTPTASCSIFSLDISPEGKKHFGSMQNTQTCLSPHPSLESRSALATIGIAGGNMVALCKISRISLLNVLCHPTAGNRRASSDL
jgi:hypothetical protein